MAAVRIIRWLVSSIHDRQIDAEECWSDDENHCEDAPRSGVHKCGQHHTSYEFDFVLTQSACEADLSRGLWRHVEHTSAKCRLERREEAGEIYGTEQRHRMQKIRHQLAFRHVPPRQDVIEHWRNQERHCSNQHPQRELVTEMHLREYDGVDDNVQTEYTCQRKAEREEDDVQLLVPSELLGEQNPTGISPDEFHVALGPLLVALLEGEVIDRESVSYTHLRAHETRHDLVCRLLLEKKKNK